MTASPNPYVEPWLRGTHADVPAAARAVLHALELAQDDLARWTEDLTDTEVHAAPLGLTPVAYHLRHIARSTDRILSYAEGRELSPRQRAALQSEAEGREPPAALRAEVETALQDAAMRVRLLAATDLDAARAVGRKRLPTSVGGAMLHVADHTLRHVGQVVTTAKVLRALRG